MAASDPEVLVLGAGIAGCALAYHLTRRSISVTVYDPATPAAGASGRAAGVVTEQLWDRWDVEVTRESNREYAELAHRWDPAAYQANGFVRFTARSNVAEAVDEARERLRSWGVDVEEASPEELSRWVPEGRYNDVLSTLVSRHDACVTPSSITTIYAEGAREAGAVFDFGLPMESLRYVDGRYELTRSTGILRARKLVVAAGAWSKQILVDLDHPLPLVPYRTQAALLRPTRRPAEPFPTVHDLDTDVYVRPESNGRILAGDGTEDREADPKRFVTGGDEEFLAHIAESLAARFPGWSESEMVSSWAGVCTATPDRHPLIGPVPGAEGLYVLSGFNGFGVMRAGGASRRLADLLASGDGDAKARAALGPAWAPRFEGRPAPFSPRPGFTLEGGDRPRF
ncbi:MAG: FAD-binding oxidoreductase [Thermoplasmata archaeon]|nr:FAD-binding oxidoreductase [Thermoplasmata archaeon]